MAGEGGSRKWWPSILGFRTSDVHDPRLRIVPDHGLSGTMEQISKAGRHPHPERLVHALVDRRGGHPHAPRDPAQRLCARVSDDADRLTKVEQGPTGFLVGTDQNYILEDSWNAASQRTHVGAERKVLTAIPIRPPRSVKTIAPRLSRTKSHSSPLANKLPWLSCWMTPDTGRYAVPKGFGRIRRRTRRLPSSSLP